MSHNQQDAATNVDPASTLSRWLDEVLRREGRDLFLVAGLPPSIRVGDEILPLDASALDGAQIEQAVRPALPAHAVEQFTHQGYTDVSIRHTGGRRFRLNLHHERGRPAATIRALPAAPPQLDDLGAPIRG